MKSRIELLEILLAAEDDERRAAWVVEAGDEKRDIC